MSGYTMTQGELLYSFYGAATTSVPTASAVTITAGCPDITVPATYFSTLGKKSSSLKLVVGGLLTATATVPTFLFGCYFSTTEASFPSSTTLFTTGTVTPSAGTAAPWWMTVDIGIRTQGLGAASTVVAMGKVECPGLFPSPFALTIPATGASATVATWDLELTYYLWPYLTLGAATAGNTVTVQYAKLYGEN